MERAILSRIQRRKCCYALTTLTLLNAIRMLNLAISLILSILHYFSKMSRLRFDGEYSHTVGSSKFSHKETYGIMNYKNQAVTTGCNHSSVCYIKTELMNMETLEWSDGPDFPFAS